MLDEIVSIGGFTGETGQECWIACVCDVRYDSCSAPSRKQHYFHMRAEREELDKSDGSEEIPVEEAEPEQDEPK
jgi:hypothetical protein